MTHKSDIVKEHEKLRVILAGIPVSRKMSYVEETRETQRFGKPRFNPPKYSIPTEVEIRLP